MVNESFASSLNPKNKGLEDRSILLKAIEQSTSSVVITNRDGVIEYVNPAFSLASGYSSEDVVGKNPRVIKSGNMENSVYAELWKSISTGNTWRGELENKTKDAEVYWEQANIFPVFNAHGEITHYVAIKDNITEQKRKERLLRCVADCNQLLLHSSRVRTSYNLLMAELGIACAVSRTYIFEYISTENSSDSFLKIMSEWTDETAVPEISNPELQRWSTTKGALLRWMPTLLNNDAVQAVITDLPEEEQHLFSKQNIKSLLIVPIFSNKKLWGLIGFDDCKTERIWTGGDISILQSIAAGLGIALHREDYEKKLQMALLRAEESAIEASRANASKSTFLATMSHEIRTPLNGVIGMTHILLEEEDLKHEHRDHLETIYRSGESLLRLLNDVLDYSKIEAGKLELRSDWFNPAQCVHDSVSLFQGQAENRKISLIANIDSSTPKYFKGDAERILQIINNLVSNAIKFTDSGTVEVLLSSAEKGQFLRLKVKDSGVGIPPEYRDQIFTMFSQADSSSTRRHGGTGLGLAICKRLVDAMNGNISYQSKINQGTLFTIDLPIEEPNFDILVPDPFKTSNHTISQQSTLEKKKPINGILKILLAEDHSVNQRLVELQLKGLGYACEIASNGLEAVEMHQKNSYDLIFMDCQMPIMDGYEATRRIIEISTAGNTPYIAALTAAALAKDNERALEAGMSDYLVKPVNKERLKLALDQYYHWNSNRTDNPS